MLQFQADMMELFEAEMAEKDARQFLGQSICRAVYPSPPQPTVAALLKLRLAPLLLLGSRRS